MRKTLVVAEKPSVARELAKVLGVEGRGSGGFIEGREYVVTWAVGHLVGIAEPEGQDPAWAGRWALRQLPMVPARFALSVLEKSRRQFEVVQELMLADRVAEVVNATDAGREGELIFRRIYLLAGCTKPVKRLWASDLTEEGLKKALSRLLPGEEKRNLGLAAFARAEADWLIGMNFSRLFTLKAGDLVTVGRVQTPVLKMLVDRRREIEAFEPRDYWTVEAAVTAATEAPPTDSTAGGEAAFQAVWHEPPDYKENKVWDEAGAAALSERCGGRPGTVAEVSSKAGRQKPPLPYDLTTLQREANTRYGLSAKRTLEVAQALYESKKLITYPRTDSQHLTEEVFGEVLEHFRAIYGLFPDIVKQAAERVKAGGKFECVNGKKVSDHHAIIPTAKRAERTKLSGEEWQVYEMVCRRFVAAFLPEVKFSSTVVWVVAEGERFKAQGKVFKDRGWLAAEPWRTAEDNPLPALRKGDAVVLGEVQAVRRQTKPPAHFTDATLLGAMETAGKLVDDEALRQAMKDRGLGTPATRAQVIETLLSRGYVDKQGKRLVATDKGAQAVGVVVRLLPEVASPELTGEWEKRLKDIEAGRDGYPEFMGSIRRLVRENVEAIRGANMAAPRQAPDQPDRPERGGEGERQGEARPARTAPAAPVARQGDPLGPCPLCGADVIEGERGYGCSRWSEGCRFVVWKEHMGGRVGRAAVTDLLKNGRTYRRIKFKSKEGKAFNAFLRLKSGQVEFFFEK